MTTDKLKRKLDEAMRLDVQAVGAMEALQEAKHEACMSPSWEAMRHLQQCTNACKDMSQKLRKVNAELKELRT
jgi:hypothetical protein